VCLSTASATSGLADGWPPPSQDMVCCSATDVYNCRVLCTGSSGPRARGRAACVPCDLPPGQPPVSAPAEADFLVRKELYFTGGTEF
jgi:hypothetical protein